jgi:hypothetical protein
MAARSISDVAKRRHAVVRDAHRHEPPAAEPQHKDGVAWRERRASDDLNVA